MLLLLMMTMTVMVIHSMYNNMALISLLRRFKRRIEKMDMDFAKGTVHITVHFENGSSEGTGFNSFLSILKTPFFLI